MGMDVALEAGGDRSCIGGCCLHPPHAHESAIGEVRCVAALATQHASLSLICSCISSWCIAAESPPAHQQLHAAAAHPDLMQTVVDNSAQQLKAGVMPARVLFALWTQWCNPSEYD